MSAVEPGSRGTRPLRATRNAAETTPISISEILRDVRDLSTQIAREGKRGMPAGESPSSSPIQRTAAPSTVTMWSTTTDQRKLFATRSKRFRSLQG
jgi:hypothetical protein